MRARKLSTQPQPSRASATSEVGRDEGSTALRQFGIDRAEGAGFVVVLRVGGEAVPQGGPVAGARARQDVGAIVAWVDRVKPTPEDRAR